MTFFDIFLGRVLDWEPDLAGEPADLIVMLPLYRSVMPVAVLEHSLLCLPLVLEHSLLCLPLLTEDMPELKESALSLL